MLQVLGRAGRFRLGESFELWHVDRTRLADAATLDDTVVFSGSAHHQIYADDDNGQHFVALTTVDDALGQMTVHSLGSGDLARSVSAAIGYFDDTEARDSTEVARLLSAASLHVRALWLPESSSVYVLHAPERRIEGRGGPHSAPDLLHYLQVLATRIPSGRHTR